MNSEPLLLPQWAESKQHTLTIRMTVRDEVSALLQQIGTTLKQAWDSVVSSVRRTMQSLAEWFKALFPRPTHLSPQSRRYLAVKRRAGRQHYVVPPYRRRVSSRRRAVQQKRKRLGLDISGRHWAYQGWKCREILEIAVCIGGFQEQRNETSH